MPLPDQLILITPQIRTREIQVIRLLSTRIPITVLSLEPPYRPLDGVDPDRVQVRLLARPELLGVPLWQLEQWLGHFGAYFPRTVSKLVLEELQRRSSTGTGTRWAWFSGPRLAAIAPQARQLGYRVIVDEDRMPSSEILRDDSHRPRNWRRLPGVWRDLQLERRRCRNADLIVTSSPLDAARAQKLAPGARIRVLPPSVEVESFQKVRQTEPREPCLVFCGDLADPVPQDGIRWFAEEVLPRLRAALGTATPRVIVGGPSAPPAFVNWLASSRIEHRTWGKDDSIAREEHMKQLLREATLCFLPHHDRRIGASFMLQAMASGRAVVSTPKGIEGLDFVPGIHLWVGEQPDTFTSAILRLIRNPELRKETIRLALDAVRTRYNDVDPAGTLTELFGE